MNISYTIAAAKFLARHASRKLLVAKIEQLATAPASLANNIKVLKGTDASRLRVGDWRFVFRIEGDTLMIESIGPRGSIYD